MGMQGVEPGNSMKQVPQDQRGHGSPRTAMVRAIESRRSRTRFAAASLQHRLVAWRDSARSWSVSSRYSGGVVPAIPSDEEFLAYNQGVISEFRANHGVVSQPPFPIPS